jgi:hypothetical protein
MPTENCTVVVCSGDSLGHTIINVLVTPSGAYVYGAGEDRFDSVVLTVDDLDRIRTAMCALEGERA